jgi:hypothetical protein
MLKLSSGGHDPSKVAFFGCLILWLTPIFCDSGW